MKDKIVRVFLLFILILLPLFGYSSEKKYYQITIDQDIDAISWLELKDGIAKAEAFSSDAIFIHLNTYGGYVLYADSMRSLILQTETPVYVFINNNAASAGALISIACDSIYMVRGANIGAATVVEQSGEKAMDKYQSYMRATMRSTAEAHGKKIVKSAGGVEKEIWHRDPIIAEAMVDETVVVDGIDDSTKILTFTAEEALKYGYCEGIYKNIDQIIRHSLKESDYDMVYHESDFWTTLKGWLLNPYLQSVLIMIIVGGIYFELQTPGIGFALCASIVAGLLYFAPLYFDGYADAWEGAVIVVGILLLLLEIFVVPGFGIFGIVGLLCLFGGLFLCMVDNDWFNFELISSQRIINSIIAIGLSLLGSVALVIYLTSKIGSDGVFKDLALNTSQDVEEGYIGVNAQHEGLVGKVGVASTVLCPSGKVFIDGDYYDAISDAGYIDEGESVIVHKFSTGRLYVRKQ